jgi:putative nucleotidyltransferase with HDIG domain
VSDPQRIDWLLEELITLPSQPTTLARITSLMNDPDCSLQQVGRIISSDPAIALKALRLVNSAHYGLPNSVVSIEHAVMLLGLKVIRNLVLSAAVFESFKKGSAQLLTHCVACGVAMRTLLETRTDHRETFGEDGFVYGLLHDIGKIIFAEYMPEESERVLELVRDDHLPPYEAERQVIGCDHAELGARLAMQWKLPLPLVESIGGHHDLSRCTNDQNRELAALLSVADYLCWASGFGPMPGSAALTTSAEVWETAGISHRNIPDLLNRFFKATPEVRELVEIAA